MARAWGAAFRSVAPARCCWMGTRSARASRPWRRRAGAAPVLHPQQAWVDGQVPHGGYSRNGMMIQAVDLLATTKNPSEDQIRTAMNGHLCRCGTYIAIIGAVQRAARV